MISTDLKGKQQGPAWNQVTHSVHFWHLKAWWCCSAGNPLKINQAFLCYCSRLPPFRSFVHQGLWYQPSRPSAWSGVVLLKQYLLWMCWQGPVLTWAATLQFWTLEFWAQAAANCSKLHGCTQLEEPNLSLCIQAPPSCPPLSFQYKTGSCSRKRLSKPGGQMYGLYITKNEEDTEHHVSDQIKNLWQEWLDLQYGLCLVWKLRNTVMCG